VREDIEDQAAAALRPTRTPPLRSALGTDADDRLALDVRVREESWNGSVTQAPRVCQDMQTNTPQGDPCAVVSPRRS